MLAGGFIPRTQPRTSPSRNDVSTVAPRRRPSFSFTGDYKPPASIMLSLRDASCGNCSTVQTAFDVLHQQAQQVQCIRRIRAKQQVHVVRGHTRNLSSGTNGPYAPEGPRTSFVEVENALLEKAINCSMYTLASDARVRTWDELLIAERSGPVTSRPLR